MATPTNGMTISTKVYQPNEAFHVCEINGSKFALFNRSIACNRTINPFDVKFSNSRPA